MNTTMTVETAGKEWLPYSGWKYRFEGCSREYDWNLFILNDKNQPVTFTPYFRIMHYTHIGAFTDRALHRRAKRIIRNKQKALFNSQRKKP